LGTYHALGLAKAKSARFLLASTSEIYGDPLVHPQPETYWGNVNPIGPRGVYDESKRFAESLTMAYHRAHGLQTRIARIFNTYGPRMRLDDGRVVPNFVGQALRGEPLTVYDDGSRTRSFCYVSDLAEGLYRLMLSDEDYPVNLGNPSEITILEFARTIIRLAESTSEIRFVVPKDERTKDDPQTRRPDITRARTLLQWEPQVDLEEGLARSIAWFRGQIQSRA
jgi:dTDP-glucose 4,6-dehydratase